MGYLFLAGALLAGATKGYCGKKTGGFVKGYPDAVFANTLRMGICIFIGLALILVSGGAGAMVPGARLLLISALSGISTSVFVVAWLLSVRRGAYMMLDVFLMLGVLIPLLFGRFLFAESITPLQWCVFFQLKIAEEYPELDKKYGMKSWGMILGEELLTATELVMDKKDLDNAGHWIDASGRWLGRLDLPHWGALACMALAKVYQENHGRKYADTVKRYHEYMASRAEEFIVSEQAYAIIGACAAYRYTGDEYYRKLAERFAHLVMKKMDADGNIPAEHYEAPAGKHLVDTIYTVNWALLGMQALAAVSEEFKPVYEKLLGLILKIQDPSPEKQFNGCWRGMYDMKTRTWGGGDRFEGGAGSIYSGWTNAPISSAIALDLLDRNLFA